MEIKKVKDKENKFILNNQKVTIKKEISEKFYQLIKEQKYDDAFDLINDSNQINVDIFRKALYILGFGSVLGTGLLYLSSTTGFNLFSGLGFITLGTSGGLLLKEVVNVVSTFKDSQNILEIITKETDYNEIENLSNDNTKSLEKTNNQTNSFVFDKNRSMDSNIIDLEEYKNKHR